MNKRLLVLGSGLFAIAILALLSCTSPGSGSSLFTSPIVTPPATTTRVAPPIVSPRDVMLAFDIGSSAAPNKPIPITITLSSKVDLRDVRVSLTLLGPSTDRRDPPRSLGDLRNNDPKQITTTLVLPDEAEYFIKIHIFTPEGFQMSDSRSIRIATDRIVVNPTAVYGPGTPAPAVPSEPRITPQPTFTPSPGVSPTPFEHSGPTGQGANADSNVTAGTVTLRGHVQFEDRDHAIRPGKYMLVKVWDWMGPTPTADRFLGETETDASGNWVLGPGTNSDPDGTRLDVYYTFETATYGSTIPKRIVVRQNGSDYAWTTRDFPTWDVPDGDQWVNPAEVNWATGSYRGMWLFNDMNRTWEYVTSIGGSEPGSIIMRWEPNINLWGYCDDACYLPIVSPGGVFIPDEDSDTPDTVVHEIGHRYRHNALGLWFFTDAPSYLSCTQHYIFSLVPNQRCAWSEGWADYFALIINSQSTANDWCYDHDGLGPCGPGSDDLENQGWWDARVANGIVGDYVEGRIAGALWDTTDDRNDLWDTRGDGFWAIWTLMHESPHEFTTREFYDAWMNRWGNSASVACRYYNNTIDYGACPIYRVRLPLILNQ